MAVASARNIVSLKEKGHFEHKNENERINKYTLADELPARLASLELRRMRPAFTLRTISSDETELVLGLLRRFFFRDEPMNQAVQLLETPESRCEQLEGYVISSMEDNLSVGAFDDSGRLVGVVVNGISRREEADYTDKSADCPDLKFRRILKVLGHLDREAKIWEKLPESCHAVLDIRIASTDSEWRGRGLMRALCEESERLAKAAGCGAIRMDTTSAFSAAAAERLGYKTVYSALYADIPDAPQPEAPHLECRVYIKEL